MINSCENIEKLINALCPLKRSLSGEAVKKSIDIIQRYSGIKFNEIKYRCGEKINDWILPPKWTLKSAFLKDSKGNIICSTEESILRVVQYSESVNKTISLSELKNHLHYSEKIDNAYPYVTSYYERNWGFCLTHNEYINLKDDTYHVFIESSFTNDFISVYDYKIKGELKNEIVFSTYLCHPEMYNNETSGPVVFSEILRILKQRKNNYSYRFVIGPETIGPICYLNDFASDIKDVNHAAYNLTCLGRGKEIRIIKPRTENIALKILKAMGGKEFNLSFDEFLTRGSDERQYNYPNVNIPMIAICRDKFNEYKEYHTNFDVYEPKYLKDILGSIDFINKLVKLHEYNHKYKCKTLCEPQLGRRGLYENISTVKSSEYSKNIVDVLNYCDGKHDIIDLKNILQLELSQVLEIIDLLKNLDLIEKI